MEHWICWIFSIFSSSANIESYHWAIRIILKTSLILYGAGWFVGWILIFFLLLECILFGWIWICFLEDFLKIFLSLHSLMALFKLHLPFTCWLDMYSMDFWLAVVSFITIIRIHTLVLFISGNARFCGIFLIIGRHRTYCGAHNIRQKYQWKFTVASNVSYFMEGWSERYY